MPNSSPHNTATRFQMRAPIHPNCTQQIQLLRGTMFFSNMQVRSNVAPLPLPPLAQSQQEHLQQINFPWCIAAPLAAHRLRIQHLLPFLTSSRDAFSQLSQLLQLQTFKGFLQLDTRWRVKKKNNMLLFIHCPNGRLNLALLARKARFKTSEDPYTFKRCSTIPS